MLTHVVHTYDIRILLVGKILDNIVLVNVVTLAVN